jgi:hypothetical protein
MGCYTRQRFMQLVSHWRPQRTGTVTNLREKVFFLLFWLSTQLTGRQVVRDVTLGNVSQSLTQSLQLRQ